MILTSKLKCLAVIAVTLAFAAGGIVAQSGLDVERIQRATVFITQARSVGESLIVTCVGSGTLVSRDGLIATNAHLTLPNAACPGDTLVIALSVRAEDSPVARFLGEVVQADSGLDLAIIRVARQIDGRLVDREALALPFVELSLADEVALDDTITVVGYPGIGEDPVRFDRTTVSGFSSEPSGGDQSWIKTSTSVPAVMSGGGVYNQNGQLIGVPTTAPLAPNPAADNCISIQDSNADGLINDSDQCVVASGFINLIRPVSFLRPLFEGSRLGLRVLLPERAVGLGTVESAPPGFRYLGFAPSVNEAGMPTSIIRSLPAGSESLYLFFDYANMTPETVYELRVNTDGIPNPAFSLSPVRWSGGERGLWYVGSTGQPFPNGTYDFTLFLNGIAEGNARLVVGGVTEDDSGFSDIVFGLLDGQGNVTGSGFVLPTGTTASARFLYRNIAIGTPWAAIWYYNGREIQRTPDDTTWNEADGTAGTKTISIQDANGLPPGSYRLELYIANRLANVADFTLAGRQDGAFSRIFSNTRFTTALTLEDAASAPPVSSFSAGISQIFGLFDWTSVADGTLWRIDLTVDDEVFFSQTQPWSAGENGSNFTIALESELGLPDGTYRMNLYVGQIQFDTAEARVGIGQLPIDRFASAEGITLRGRVVDAVSGEGLPGASVLLISEDFSVAEFLETRSISQVYATSITDRNGRFEILRPLQRDAPYSIIFLLNGYVPVTADGVEINDENRPDVNDLTPIDIVVEMLPE